MNKSKTSNNQEVASLAREAQVLPATDTPTGHLFIVSGASGTGKSSLVGQLVATVTGIVVSVSHTTRPKRPAEKDGIHYNFIDKEGFHALASRGLFLEYAQVFDHYYGTSREWVMQRLHSGIDVVLEIDWQGARQVREHMPDSIGIFILPPSRQALESRLRDRDQDPAGVIQRRLRDTGKEIAHYDEFDYLVINNHFATALEELRMIVLASRLRREVQRQRHCELLATLLAPSPYS